MKHAFRRLLLGTFYLYAAAVVLLPVLWAVFGESWWLLILLRYAPPGVFLVPVALLGLPMLLLRPRGHALAAAAVALWIVFVLMGFEWPHERARDRTPLAALTLNIRAGLDSEAPALAAFLRDSGADVVALQEARKSTAAARPDPVPELVRLLPEFHVARGGLRDELVILSRHRVLSTRVHDLAGLSEVRPGWASATPTSRGCRCGGSTTSGCHRGWGSRRARCSRSRCRITGRCGRWFTSRGHGRRGPGGRRW